MTTIGLHLLSTIKTKSTLNLLDCAIVKHKIQSFIDDLGLTSFGSVYHQFGEDGCGYTGVVCLSESHISIHTWPENLIVTLDVFLSNHSRDNQERCENFHKALIALFDVESINTNRILR